MRFPLLPALIILVLNSGVDICIYRYLRKACRHRLPSKIQMWSAIVLAAFFILMICMPKRSGSDSSLIWVMWGLYSYLTIYIPKYLFLIFDLVAQLPRAWRGRPWRALDIAGAVLGTVVFGLMWWGALINRYNIEVKRVDMEFETLPPAFDGFRIVQISDLHTGTFGDNDKFVRELVDSVVALHPDMVVFTGDIVNRRSDELKPFVKALSELRAPYGVYSVLGNHDYGDYTDWPSVDAQVADQDSLRVMEGEMGWRLLNNETAWIKLGADSLALIGVENIGDPPFKIYGSLEKAYPDINDANFKILLSHNPAHYRDALRYRDDNTVGLTLSGHTHAMQIELFGWSPAAWRYLLWGGLYDDNKGHKLYVNIGCGTVGMPFRIGANPEITLITLKSLKHR